MSIGIISKLLGGSILVLGLAACSVSGENKVIPAQAGDTSLQSFETAAEVRPVELRTVLHDMKIGQHIGALSWDIGCFQSKDMEWTDKAAERLDGRYKSSFYHELERANGKRYGDPDEVFESAPKDDSRIQVAGKILDVAFNACGGIYLISFDAEAYFKMNWQVYDSDTDEIVQEIQTEGAARNDSVPRADLEDLLIKAYEANVRKLIADPEFRQVVGPES